nr:uncharacterized protein LOC127485126 isoform X1 [Oryctolagus cuniculus]
MGLPGSRASPPVQRSGCLHFFVDFYLVERQRGRGEGGEGKWRGESDYPASLVHSPNACDKLEPGTQSRSPRWGAGPRWPRPTCSSQVSQVSQVGSRTPLATPHLLPPGLPGGEQDPAGHTPLAASRCPRCPRWGTGPRWPRPTCCLQVSQVGSRTPLAAPHLLSPGASQQEAGQDCSPGCEAGCGCPSRVLGTRPMPTHTFVPVHVWWRSANLMESGASWACGFVFFIKCDVFGRCFFQIFLLPPLAPCLCGAPAVRVPHRAPLFPFILSLCTDGTLSAHPSLGHRCPAHCRCLPSLARGLHCPRPGSWVPVGLSWCLPRCALCVRILVSRLLVSLGFLLLVACEGAVLPSSVRPGTRALGAEPPDGLLLSENVFKASATAH